MRRVVNANNNNANNAATTSRVPSDALLAARCRAAFDKAAADDAARVVVTRNDDGDVIVADAAQADDVNADVVAAVAAATTVKSARERALEKTAAPVFAPKARGPLSTDPEHKRAPDAPRVAPAAVAERIRARRFALASADAAAGRTSGWTRGANGR